MGTTTQAAKRGAAAHPKGLPPIKVDAGPTGPAGTVVGIGVGATPAADYDWYVAEPLNADFGPAFTMRKLTRSEEGPYSVNLSGMGNCDCKAHGRWGTCRHVRALLLLWSRGQLDVSHHPRAVLARQDAAAAKGGAA